MASKICIVAIDLQAHLCLVETLHQRLFTSMSFYNYLIDGGMNLWRIIDSEKLSFSPYRRGVANIKRIIEKKVIGTKRIAGFGLIEVPPGGVFPPHTHPEREEIYYVLSGSGTIVVEDQEIQAKEGLTFYVSGEPPHGVRNRGNESLVVLFVTVYV